MFSKINLANNALPKVYGYINIIDLNISFVLLCHETEFLYALNYLWLSILVFLPGESHGQRSLAGHSPWGDKESGMIE